MKRKTLTIIPGIALIFSVIANTYQYKVNCTLHETLTVQEADISALTDTIHQLENDCDTKSSEIAVLNEEVTSLLTTIDALQHPKEIYWTLTVEDYEIFLQEGAAADTLELMYRKDTLVSSLLTLQKEYDYQTPTDITAEAFTECLGHNGFCLYTRRPLGTELHYYKVDYYPLTSTESAILRQNTSRKKTRYIFLIGMMQRKDS